MLCSALLVAKWLQGCSRSDAEELEHLGARVANATPLFWDDWGEHRGFVVFIQPGCCTGIISRNIVLTAEHCVGLIRPPYKKLRIKQVARVNGTWEAATSKVLRVK